MKRLVLKHRRWWRLALPVTIATVLIALPTIFTGSVGAVQRKVPRSVMLSNFDIRVTGQKALAELLKDRTTALKRGFGIASRRENNVTAIREQRPELEVKASSITGSTEMIESRTGSITEPAPGHDGIEIVRGFLRSNSDLYGIDSREVESMRFISESVSPSGLRMVRFEQMVNGIPIFQSETRAILAEDGRLVRTLGLLVGGTEFADPLDNLISPAEALAGAMESVGYSPDRTKISVEDSNAAGTIATVHSTNRNVKGEVPSKLVYFAIAPGVLIPAWSQVFFTEGEFDWYTIVNAQNGSLLWRKNIRDDISTHDARFRVYVQADGTTPADSPAPHSPTTNTVGMGTQYAEIAPTIVSMLTAQNATASPNGWINDCPGGGCTANETQTIGNNVHAYLDRFPFSTASGGNGDEVPDTDAAGVIDGNGKPTGNPDSSGRNRDFLGTTPRDFQTNYLPAPQGGNPEAGQTASGAGTSGTAAVDQFRRGMLTQLFYVTNWYHDQLFSLGFNEAAGNFQTTNFSGMGLGNDRVLAEGVNGISINNANFSTPPDGTSGRCQMFVFTGPTIDRDGALDAEVLMHELTHGTSNRLIGNGAGLNWHVGAGMGEGWSDFYALSLLNNTNADNPDGLYASGAYATYKLNGSLENYVYGIRRFPYTTDNTINPMTWADADDITNNLSGGIAPSPITFNNNGAFEVHNTGEIWCLTLWEVRSRIIHDAAGANNDVPTGNHTMLQLVTDAMKMTPISPSLVDARDAIIAADGATHSYANEESIWGGFADRGLGYNAVAPVTRMFGFRAGHIGVGESFSVPYLDKATTTVSDTACGNSNGAIDPGEVINLTVGLKNPWHKASKGVASATATLTSSTSGVTILTGSSTYGAIAAQATVNGTPFKVGISNSLTAGQALDFTITSTSALGVQAVNFKLRVGTPAGTGAPITYTQTIASPFLAIPDFAPRGVTNAMTVTDDFEIADLNFRVDDIHHTFTGDLTVELKGPTGYGTDLIAAIGGLVDGGPGDNLINMVIDDQATADMLATSAASAPFTGSWLPIFNDPSWVIAGFGPQDPVGNLSRFNGSSTKGTWTVEVSDQFSADTGTLRAWSLIVTPRAFTATPFTLIPPSITCPANITATAPASCPFGTGVAVTYPAPTVGGNCGVGAPVCSPPSGGSFPLGTSTVTCTVTDFGGNTASCSFTVTVFNICLQDDSNPGTVLLINSASGAYRFCCGGTIFTGTGTIAIRGCVLTLQHNPPDRRVSASVDQTQFKGNAVIQFPVGSIKCTIGDRDTRNNSCTCQ